MKKMLESIAWRKTWEEWGLEMEVKPKLSVLKKITDRSRRIVRPLEAQTERWQKNYH